MSAATVAFGEPPIASPELALVDAALAAELRRSLPDPATPPRLLPVAVAVAEPETDSRPETEAEASPRVGAAPELESPSNRVLELVSGPTVEQELASEAPDETIALDVTDPMPELAEPPSEAPLDPVDDEGSRGGADDLIVGYWDETASESADSAESALEQLDTQIADILDLVGEHEAIDGAVTHDVADELLRGDCDDLIVGLRAEPAHSEKPASYPTLPVPDDGLDTTGETDIALRSIQSRLTADPSTLPKRRFRRRFTLMSAVVGLCSVLALTAQLYAGGIVP